MAAQNSKDDQPAQFASRQTGPERGDGFHAGLFDHPGLEILEDGLFQYRINFSSLWLMLEGSARHDSIIDPIFRPSLGSVYALEGKVGNTMGLTNVQTAA